MVILKLLLTWLQSHSFSHHILIIATMKVKKKARRWWLTPAILATQEAEIRRIMVQSQPGQIVGETLSFFF
jgi:hypothetical protein